MFHFSLKQKIDASYKKYIYITIFVFCVLKKCFPSITTLNNSLFKPFFFQKRFFFEIIVTFEKIAVVLFKNVYLFLKFDKTLKF